MRRLAVAALCLAIAAIPVLIAGTIGSWTDLVLLWFLWLATPLVLTALAVLAGHASPLRGIVITTVIVGANLVFHAVVLGTGDALAFFILPPLTFLTLVAAVAMLALSPAKN
jgi:hypothetical protein